jgi:hypothetical protein
MYTGPTEYTGWLRIAHVLRIPAVKQLESQAVKAVGWQMYAQ